MRILAILILTALFAPPAFADGDGFAGFFRSITGVLGSGGRDQPAKTSSSTATIGVRGMDDGGTKASGPAATEDLKLLDGWVATQADAKAAASKRGLKANNSVKLGNATKEASGDKP